MNHRTASIILLLTLVLSLTSSSANAADEAPLPLGRLTVHATADVGTPPDTITITDDARPYFAGERVATGSDGRAVLTLPEGAVVLGPDSALRVNRGSEGWRIDLERGALRARFECSAAFEIAAGDVRLRPQAEQNAKEIDTLVTLDGARGVTVVSRSGTLETIRPDGARALVVAAGETRTVATTGETPMADVAAGEEQSLNLLKLTGAGAGGAAALGGGGYLLDEEVLDDDDDDDDPVTSAVR